MTTLNLEQVETDFFESMVQLSELLNRYVDTYIELPLTQEGSENISRYISGLHSLSGSLDDLIASLKMIVQAKGISL